MAAVLEAESAATPFNVNVNIQKEKVRYENQNESNGWLFEIQQQPEGVARPEGQEWRQGWYHRHLISICRIVMTSRQAVDSKAGR